MPRTGQEFYMDLPNNKFYYVNYQEEGYVEITEDQKELHNFIKNIFCFRWEHRDGVVDSFRLVETIEDIYLTEDEIKAKTVLKSADAVTQQNNLL